ncbi:DnaB-like helicase N-terminal domain-containing protein [Escherichia coli]|uniref:DnaB-like helicase N-terminal domain-containing protein n=1 Tax=Escherichia coli TaxID=562 RepID=UPI00339C0558
MIFIPVLIVKFSVRWKVLLSHGKPIDLITLAEALEQNGKSERAGGFAYLADMSKNTP